MARSKLAVRTLALIGAATVLIGWADPGNGALLRVERDGTGNFNSLLEAITFASSGDTLLVGPGRYAEAEDFSVVGDPRFAEPTIVPVAVDTLTIIGVDRAAVILGPESYDPRDAYFAVAMKADSGQHLTLRNLSVENVRTALFLSGSCIVDSCTVVADQVALRGYGLGQSVIRDSSFKGVGFGGVIVAEASQDVLFDRCVVTDSPLGMGFVQVVNAEVRDSSVNGCETAIQFENGSGGTVERSDLRGTRYTFVSVAGAHPVLLQNRIETTGEAALALYNDGRVTGSFNRFLGGTWATLNFISVVFCELHDNDVVAGPGYYAVRVDHTNLENPAPELDLTRNYWGTTSLDSVAARIFDATDDSLTNGLVQFEPIRDRSVPTNRGTMGRLKLDYRRSSSQ